MKVFSELRLYICNHIISNVLSHTIRLWYYKKIMNFKIGKNSTILMRLIVDSAKGIIIGNNSVINVRS
jgi:serine acetyltransferase